MQTLGATEFKAHCLAVLDRVARTGEEVTITKHGKPVARLVPPSRRGGGPKRHPLVGTVDILGDVIGPVLPTSTWSVLRDDEPLPLPRTRVRRRGRKSVA